MKNGKNTDLEKQVQGRCSPKEMMKDAFNQAVLNPSRLELPLKVGVGSILKFLKRRS